MTTTDDDDEDTDDAPVLRLSVPHVALFSNPSPIFHSKKQAHIFNMSVIAMKSFKSIANLSSCTQNLKNSKFEKVIILYKKIIIIIP